MFTSFELTFVVTCMRVSRKSMALCYAAVSTPTKRLCNYLKASTNMEAKGLTAVAHYEALMKYKREHFTSDK